MSELLAPPRKPLEAEFERGFVGMTATPIELEELEAAREQMIRVMVSDMPETHREFLLSAKRGESLWNLLPVGGVEVLPAVKWRLQNLEKRPPNRKAELLEALRKILRNT